MSIRIPSRRLARPAAVLNGTLNSSLQALTLRTLSTSSSRSVDPPKSNDEEDWNPLLAAYNAKARAVSGQKPNALARPSIPAGALPPTSIFDAAPERSAAEKSAMAAREAAKTKKQQELWEKSEAADTRAAKAVDGKGKDLLDKRIAAYALDPFPEKRRLWERKQVIRTITKRGRLTKKETLARTERTATFASPFLNTSVKKLTKLANQIAGKPIDAAIVQMRFSKKKVAQEVEQMLQYSRDAAVVKHGMGLGKAEGRTGGEVEVEDKDGRKRIVRDRTGLYVEQAWVGRGAYTNSWMARARGRADIIRHPTTSISFVLKEEATRIRLSEEYKKKRDNRKLWVQLPDRPITAQRQYALW